jgi:predicted RND superfamily exporter protein
LEKSSIDILTKLTVDEVRSKLQEVVVDSSNGRQTQYHQKYIGKVNTHDAKFSRIYAAAKNIIYYELKFQKSDNLTIVSISNSEYDRRQVTSALLKGLMLPIGCVILIMGIVFYSDFGNLISTTFVSLIIILFCALYKPKPLTREEYLNDEIVLELIAVINGYLGESNEVVLAKE